MRHGVRIAVMGDGVRLAAPIRPAGLMKEAIRLDRRHGRGSARHVASEDENPTSVHAADDLDRASFSFPDRSLARANAKRGIERSGQMSADALDTMVEAGDFEAAMRWENQAIELQTDREEKADYAARLALYREKKPYRDARP